MLRIHALDIKGVPRYDTPLATSGMIFYRSAVSFHSRSSRVFQQHLLPNLIQTTFACFTYKPYYNYHPTMLQAKYTTDTVVSHSKEYMNDLSNYDAEQARLMGEMCIVVDEQDRVVGADSKKACHLMSNINKGLLHRAFSVFIFDEQERLLLQQRADEKITFPGYFTNTCCSHPLYLDNERIEENQMGARMAAQRKLEHELGIPKSQIDLNKLEFLTRIHYLAPSDGKWGEHEIDYIFIYRTHSNQLSLDPNPNEVKSCKFVTRSELKDMFKQAEQGEIQMTPWFRLIVENFLYGWWDQLSLPVLPSDSKIHRM